MEHTEAMIDTIEAITVSQLTLNPNRRGWTPDSCQSEFALSLAGFREDELYDWLADIIRNLSSKRNVGSSPCVDPIDFC